MFQLTTPLTPAPGRAGLPGVRDVAAGTGAKGTVDLPDFLSLALHQGITGKARQDPAGDGEAVPGGTAIAAPAGHPADADAGQGVSVPSVAAADAVMPVIVVLGNAPAAPVAASPQALQRAPLIRFPTATGIAADAIKPDKAAGAPSIGSVSAAVPALPEPAATPGTRPARAPTRRQAMPDVRALNDPIVEQDPALSTGKPQVAEAADTAPGPPLRQRATKRGAPDEAAATAVATPSVAAILPTLPPAPAPAEPIAASATPVVTAGAARPIIRTARAAPQLVGGRTTRPAAVGPVDQAIAAAPEAGPAASSITAPDRAVRRPDTAGVSLGAVARMLESAAAPAPGPAGAAIATPVAFAPGLPAPALGAPALGAPAPPVAPLPAMPASVAAFLASVGTQPVPVPASDVAPRLDPESPVADRAVGTPPSKANASVSVPAPVPTSAPAPAAATPITIRPAAQMFADAIHAATGQGERLRRGPGETDAAGLSSASVITAPAAPAAIAERAPIDMTRAHWPLKMIERIEVLRDAADAQDTRIRLVPDALGAIDVSMTRDGDTVRVHLAADRPETRAMIADAQPRLAELGEQRGLKIAGSTGHGASQTGAQDFHQPRGNPAPHQPARPASARAGDPSTTDEDGGQRLA